MELNTAPRYTILTGERFERGTEWSSVYNVEKGHARLASGHHGAGWAAQQRTWCHVFASKPVCRAGGFTASADVVEIGVCKSGPATLSFSKL